MRLDHLLSKEFVVWVGMLLESVGLGWVLFHGWNVSPFLLFVLFHGVGVGYVIIVLCVVGVRIGWVSGCTLVLSEFVPGWCWCWSLLLCWVVVLWVVVWELYSGREHLLGTAGVGLIVVLILLFLIVCKLLRAHGGCLGIRSR